MKAITIPRHGERDVLTYTSDQPTPVPVSGEVLIQIACTGINHVDLVVRRGYPSIPIPLPHIPGGDITGTVLEAGPDVSRDLIGKRVVVYPLIACGKCQLCREGRPNLCLGWKYFGLHLKGGYAEYCTVPAGNCFVLPDSISFDSAAGLPIAGLTALHALKGVGGLSAGQTFFIWGGAGGLGTIAIQIAKRLGATVIATAGSDDRLALMTSLGADHVFNRKRDDVPAEVMKLCPAGVDLIIDYVGPETFPKSFQMVKKGGRILLCGIITGREVPNFSLHMTYLRHLSIQGLYLGTKVEMQEIIDLAASGAVKVQVGAELPLAEAARAQQMLEEGAVAGKIVLRVA
ncbi:MAG: zinc-binding dehydrogenase [Calditrichaeota bacterium]|nr:zinc-binding dehydrogenase [Calditrichota bacterium]